MNTNRLLLAALLAISTLGLGGNLNAASYVTIKEGKEGRFDVHFGGKHFTSLLTKGHAKPILYPIIGPHGVRMTRDYPMKEGTKDERKDHPHHASLWYTHGDVNGISFWHVGKNTGEIIPMGKIQTKERGSSATIDLANKWVGPKGKTICTDAQTITFHKYRNQGDTTYAAIDYKITIKATEGDVTFGDTKEGSMGIRTHAGLRINKGANAVNSEGVKGASIWGKRAKWVDYSATIDGHEVGVAIFDHPTNPRYPTWWHARDYGLVAANPFGVHNFERKPRGTGDLKISKGEEVTFRYRFVFHSGNTQSAGIEGLFGQFASDQ